MIFRLIRHYIKSEASPKTRLKLDKSMFILSIMYSSNFYTDLQMQFLFRLLDIDVRRISVTVNLSSMFVCLSGLFSSMLFLSFILSKFEAVIILTYTKL